MQIAKWRILDVSGNVDYSMPVTITTGGLASAGAANDWH
jgi:hypothetical protein